MVRYDVQAWARSDVVVSVKGVGGGTYEERYKPRVFCLLAIAFMAVDFQQLVGLVVAQDELMLKKPAPPIQALQNVSAKLHTFGTHANIHPAAVIRPYK